MIGNTPMLELTQFDTGPCRLFVKLENQNPGGSIKDRVALSMIEQAERDGKLQPGGTIIEATAGNTGSGLALVAALKGYKLLLVVPDKMSREKIFHLRALGVEVLLTRSDVGKGIPLTIRITPNARPGRSPAPFISISSTTRPIRRPIPPLPPPSCGGRWSMTWTLSWLASAPAARWAG